MSSPHADSPTADTSLWSFTGQVDKSLPARRIPIFQSTTSFRVGRMPDLGLTINSDCVSKEHAEVVKREDQLFLRDLGSTNGTYINGERIQDEMPVNDGDVLQFGVMAFRVGRERIKKGSLTTRQSNEDGALATMQFDRLIREEAVVPMYQPIVSMTGERDLIGYEILGRSELYGLQMPAQMFSVASQLGMERDLSRLMRRRGLVLAEGLNLDVNLFVNTHPRELSDDGLIDSLRATRNEHPDRMITLEIHEVAVTGVDQLLHLRECLSELDIGLAFDDFGAGQDRLIELCEVTPDYLKFDMALTQGIGRAAPSRQRLVAALVEITKSIGCVPLAEGVEDEASHEVLAEVGFELGQGHLYGKPASISRCIDVTHAKSERRASWHE